ncbi:prohead serine protease [Janthinobacterium sp. 75]|nr:prohead serine protease [Janthinobacterium sp. 75]
MPMLSRAAELVPATFSEADNTVDVVWTVGGRVRRYDWYSDAPYEEELLVTPEAVDMARFDAGVVQVLDGHSTYGGVAAIIGIATRASIENGEGRATLRLSVRPEMAGIVADIKAGIIRAISFGYSVTKYEITRAIDRTDGVNMPLYRAVAWQPYEISFVTVPADANASTREKPSNGTPCEFIRSGAAHPATHTNQEPNMTPEEIAAQAAQRAADLAATQSATNAAQAAMAAAEAAATAAAVQRSADITDMCTRHGVGQLAAGLIRGGSSVDQSRAAVLEELARRDAAQGGHRNVQIQTVSDEQETRMLGMEEAIIHRVHSRSALTDNGRQFRGMSLLEIGREFLQSRGIETRGMDKMRLAAEMLQFRSGMHSTSDFGALFANVANKRLRSAYDENPGTYAQWARRAPNAPDFKNISVVQLSGAPELLQTNEHGEFKYGTMKDGAETYAVLTHGRIVALTRQAIINDDLRGFDRLVSAFGNSARRLENRTVYSQLTANAKMGDGIDLFHADHANISNAAAALGMDGLKAGRTAMRLQKGLQKEELNIAPNFLIVPASLEQVAYQLTSANYVPAKQSDINEFRAGGRTAVQPIVEPILDGISAVDWYLASDSGQIDTVEYCYLDGAEGPVIESQIGFDTDGISYKCRLDFAAKAVDFRGMYKGRGA